MTDVALCVLTAQRPEGLRRMLESIADLRLPERVEQLVVVVIDNDVSRASPAQPVCDAVAAARGLTIECIVELQRGIPFARNAALDATVERFDVVGFVDDDEQLRPDWLERMLGCLDEHDADAVTGPIRGVFSSTPPTWAVAGGYFDSPTRPATGTRVPQAYTGNVLMRAAALRASGLRFDARFALSGGSDTHFFLRFAAQGHAIVWCDEAEASEWIPASRVTHGWLLRRSFRIGTSTSLCERYLAPGPRTVGVRLAKACVRIVQGVALLPVNALLPGRRPFDALRLVYLGAGMLNGLTGRHYQEYEHLHTD